MLTRVLDGPGVDVGLGAVGELPAAAGEPGEQGGGLEDLFTGVAAPDRADRPVLGAGSEPGQDVPGREAAQDLGVVRVGEPGQVLMQPSFEQQDLLVDGGQQPAGHE
jgi:hypothetical protein